MWCGRDRVGRSHSVDVVGDDDGYASSDLDGGDELGEKKVVGREKGKKGGGMQRKRDCKEGFWHVCKHS